MTPLDVLRAYHAAFNDKDWSLMASLTDEGVLHFPNQGTLRKGRAAFEAFLREAGAAYSEVMSGIVYYTSETEGRIAAEYVVNGVYLVTQPGLPEANGQKYVLTGGAFFEVSSGRIRRICTYYNLKDWIDQIREQTPAP
jgi:steroid delta-isomerase-like uncharacterized protein